MIMSGNMNAPSLHARRRNHTSDEELATSSHKGGDNGSPNKRKRRLLQQFGIPVVDLQQVVIYIVVIGFVVIGFVFGYLLIHHQHRKVIVHVIRNPWAHGRAAFRIATTHRKHTIDGFHHHFYTGNPKFVTVVLPSVVNPNGRNARLETIHDTWGPYARAIYVVHDISEFSKAEHLTMSDDKHPYDRYSFPQNLLLPTDIGVDQGIMRLYYTIRSIYERVNPDFAFFVNDHTYVIPSHLCHYLEMHHSADIDLYAGHALKNDKSTIFNSGAAGYVLSRETMKKLIQKFDDKDPNCWIDANTDHPNKTWLEGNPGLVIVNCLRSMGIVAFDTRAQNKYHRFHAFPLVRMVTGDVDKWYINKNQIDELPTEVRTGFDASYSTLLFGSDCCAVDSISFHYVEARECKALFTIQQILLENPHIHDTSLQQLMISHWPNDVKVIGGYSRKLPKVSDEDTWSELLKTIRNISRKETQKEC